MLQQMPGFLSAMHAMEGLVDLADHLVVVNFDAAAQRLCTRQHRPEQCVLDSWNTTGMGKALFGVSICLITSSAEPLVP